MARRSPSAFAALASSALLIIVALSQPSSALDRTDGSCWTYDVRFDIMDVPVTGTMTQSFVGGDRMGIDGANTSVDVVRFEGAFSGQVTVLGMTRSVTGVCEGRVLAAPGEMSVLRWEARTLANLSVGTDDLRLAEYLDKTETVMYSAPLMSGFDADGPVPGSSWWENITETSTLVYDDGTTVRSEGSSETVHRSFSVDALEQVVSTPAGEFDAVRLIVECGEGLTVLLYAREVGNFVRVEMYGSLSEEPSFVAELSAFAVPADGSITPVAIGAVASAASVLAAVSVLALRRGRRPGTPPERADGDGRGDMEAEAAEGPYGPGSGR